MFKSIYTIITRLLVVIFFSVFTLSSIGNRNFVYAATGDVQWAKTTSPGAPSTTVTFSVAVDSQNNSYQTGYLLGSESYDFGNGVVVSGGYENNNAFVIKYNSSGQAQWARSTAAGTSLTSYFNTVVVDSDGNVYVAGKIQGAGDIDFGNGTTYTNSNNANEHLLLVKYNSLGEAQWIKVVVSVVGSGSNYTGLAVDNSNNIYAAGWVQYPGVGPSYNFGNGVTIVGTTLGAAKNPLLVKYNSDGLAQWAYSTQIGSSSYSYFTQIAVAPDSTIYAVGQINGTGSDNFGNDVTLTGGNAGNNAFIVKYSNSGVAQWGRSTGVGALGSSEFSDVAIDTDNNAYTVGYVTGPEAVNFGDGVTVTGIADGESNAVLVKYDNVGQVQWARSLTASEMWGSYNSGIKIDPLNNIYVVGSVYMTGSYGFGNGVNFNIDLGDGGENGPYLVKYNVSGEAQFVRTAISGTYVDVTFNELALDTNQNILVAGYLYGSELVGFGNGVSVAGGYAAANNSLLLKYEGESAALTPTPTPTPTSSPSSGSSYSPAPDGQRSTTDTPVCSDQAPGKTDLFQVTSLGVSSASVHFAPTSDPVSSYFISFGETEVAEGYSANLDLGHVDGAITYTLELLKPNTTYYVKVKASHGCMSGDWSTTIPFRTSSYTSYFPGSTISSSFQPNVVLGAVTEDLKSPELTPTKAMTPKKATSTSPTPTSKPSKPWYMFW